MPNASNVTISDASNVVHTVSTIDQLLAVGLFLNQGIPAGANVIGNVSITSMPGLPTGANVIGGTIPQVNGAVITASNPMPIYDAYLAPSTVTWTVATSLNTVFSLNTAGMDTVILTVVPSGTITAGAVAFEAFDGTNWVSVKAPRTDSYSTDSIFVMTGSPGSHSWQIPVAGYPQFRARLSTALTGAGASAAIVGIVSSSPDTSIVTVGLDPAQALPAGTNTLGAVKLLDGAGTALTSDTRGAKQALTVEIVDGSGTQITTFGGTLSGGLPTGANTIGSVKLLDGAGTGITSDLRGAKQALTVEIVDGSGTQITAFGGTLSGGLPTGANTIGSVKLTDGTNVAAVKAGSTAPVVGDPAMVVAISPNSINPNGQALKANSAPVTIASDQGPLTVTAASNGYTKSRVFSAATTNGTSLKTSAGNIVSIDVFNTAAYTVFLKMYNKASAPTVGTDTPTWTIPIAAGGGFSREFSAGDSYATGIAYAITKLEADSDTTVVASGDLTGQIRWI